MLSAYSREILENRSSQRASLGPTPVQSPSTSIADAVRSVEHEAIDNYPRAPQQTTEQRLALAIMSTRMSLTEQRQSLVAYLGAKTKAEDWHAVADAASDLREVDVQLRLLDRLAP